MPDESPLHIGFVLFPALTQLDLTGPWEVLTRLPNAQCHLLSQNLEPVQSASGGLRLLPTQSLAACPQLGMICVPGGPGHLAAMEDEVLLGFLRRQAPDCQYVTAVCTGALVLAAAGLLRGYRATTHWMSMHRLAAFGAEPVHQRVVIDRDRITGGGVTAGIDFALTIAAHLGGEITAREIQLQIEYDPQPVFCGSPASAAPETISALRAQAASYSARMQETDRRAAQRFCAE